MSETERRRARQGRRQQRNRFVRILAAFGMGVLAVLIIIGLALPSFGGGQSAGPDDFIERGGFFARPTDGPGEFFPDQGRLHLTALDARVADGYYNSTPPTSGTHSPTWERCGVFTEPVSNEIQVHNLEHGFVNILYNTDDAGLVGELEAAARQLPDWPNYYMFAPYPDMEHTIALTAWNYLLTLDEVDEDAMREFADAYQARGPELARGCDAPGVMEAAETAVDPTADAGEPATTPIEITPGDVTAVDEQGNVIPIEIVPGGQDSGGTDDGEGGADAADDGGDGSAPSDG